MIISCPYCTAPLAKMRDDVDIGSAGMDLKCPHCKKVISVEIRREIVIILDGRPAPRKSEPNIR